MTMSIVLGGLVSPFFHRLEDMEMGDLFLLFIIALMLGYTFWDELFAD